MCPAEVQTESLGAEADQETGASGQDLIANDFWLEEGKHPGLSTIQIIRLLIQCMQKHRNSQRQISGAKSQKGL